MADATFVVPIDEIVFDRTLYPRQDSQSPAKVQEYALSIAEGRFPPILLTHDYRILWVGKEQGKISDSLSIVSRNGCCAQKPSFLQKQ